MKLWQFFTLHFLLCYELAHSEEVWPSPVSSWLSVCCTLLFCTRRLTRNKLQLQSLVSQQQRYLLCYQWLHEDLLSTSGQSSQGQSTRKEVLTELHKVKMSWCSASLCHLELGTNLRIYADSSTWDRFFVAYHQPEPVANFRIYQRWCLLMLPTMS